MKNIIIISLVISILVILYFYKKINDKKQTEVVKEIVKYLPGAVVYKDKIVTKDVIVNHDVVHDVIHNETIYASYEDSIKNYCKSDDYFNIVESKRDELQVLIDEFNNFENRQKVGGILTPAENYRKTQLSSILIPTQQSNYTNLQNRCVGIA